MPEVDPEAVVALTTESDASEVAELTLQIITAMAKAYTRGHGFDTFGEPSEEIAAVITTASARFIGNPKQTSTVTTIGPFTTDVRSHFQGWTLAELFVLNRYRVRAR
jgi:hypothetical protein